MISRTRAVVAAIWLLAIGAVPALAQRPSLQPGGGSSTAATQPVATVAITGLDRLLSDINYITLAAETPQSGLMVGSMVSSFSEGIDRARPAGVLVFMGPAGPAPLVVLPVTDLTRFLKGLEAFLPPPEVDSDGLMTLQVGPQLLFVKESEGWAFAARDRETLAMAPSDPSAILGPLTKNHDLTLSLNVQALPPELRKRMMDQLQAGFEQTLNAQVSDPAAQEIQRQTARQQLEMLKKVIDQSERLQIGWVVNPNEQYTGLDILSTAAEGTEMAQMAKEVEVAPSRFTGLLKPGAAAMMHASVKYGPLYQKQNLEALNAVPLQMKAMLDNAVDEGKLDAESRAIVEDLVKDVLDMSRETIQKGFTDLAMVVRTDNDKLGVALALAPSNGAKLEQMAAKLKGIVESKTSEVQFKLNASKYNGVNMHVVEVNIPEGEAGPRKVFGDKLQVFIGTAADAIYLGLGPEGENLVKSAIDSAAAGSPKMLPNQPPSQFQVSILPIMAYVQSVAPNSAVDMVLQKMREYPELTDISFVSQLIPRGSVIRFRVEEGILRAAGQAAMSARQQPQF